MTAIGGKEVRVAALGENACSEWKGQLPREGEGTTVRAGEAFAFCSALVHPQHRRILRVLGTATTKATINAMIIVTAEPLKPQPANINYSRAAPGAFNASGSTSLPKSSSRGF